MTIIKTVGVQAARRVRYCLLSSHVVVVVRVSFGALVLLVVVVRRHDLLAELLLSLVYVGIQLVSVLSDRELLVVVDRDVDPSVTDWFVVRVVELCHVRVSQRLLGREALVRVKLEQVLNQVDGLVRCAWEHVSDAPLLGGWQRLQHSRGEWTLDGLDVFGGWAAGDFHDPIELVER